MENFPPPPPPVCKVREMKKKRGGVCGFRTGVWNPTAIVPPTLNTRVPISSNEKPFPINFRLKKEVLFCCPHTRALARFFWRPFMGNDFLSVGKGISAGVREIFLFFHQNTIKKASIYGISPYAVVREKKLFNAPIPPSSFFSFSVPTNWVSTLRLSRP